MVRHYLQGVWVWVRVRVLVNLNFSFLCQNDGLPALVTLKKGLVALARQWMKFIVVTQAFKAVGLLRPNQLPKPKEPASVDPELGQGVDNGAALQSDTSADGVEFEFDAGNPPAASHTQIHCVGSEVSNPGSGVSYVLHVFAFPHTNTQF